MSPFIRESNTCMINTHMQVFCKWLLRRFFLVNWKLTAWPVESDNLENDSFERVLFGTSSTYIMTSKFWFSHKSFFRLFFFLVYQKHTVRPVKSNFQTIDSYDPSIWQQNFYFSIFSISIFQIFNAQIQWNLYLALNERHLSGVRSYTLRHAA